MSELWTPGGDPPYRSAQDYAGLLSSREFAAEVDNRRVNRRVILTELAVLERTLQELRDHLEAEILR